MLDKNYTSYMVGFLDKFTIIIYNELYKTGRIYGLLWQNVSNIDIVIDMNL